MILYQKPFTEAEFHNTFQAALEMETRVQAAQTMLRIEQKQFLFEMMQWNQYYFSVI